MIKFTSNFALLDIKKGREQLAKHFEDKPGLGKCPENLRIPVTITGYIEGDWGDDNGTSQEFSVEVTDLKLEMPEKSNL